MLEVIFGVNKYPASFHFLYFLFLLFIFFPRASHRLRGQIAAFLSGPQPGHTVRDVSNTVHQSDRAIDPSCSSLCSSKFPHQIILIVRLAFNVSVRHKTSRVKAGVRVVGGAEGRRSDGAARAAVMGEELRV